ncbi:MAG TPA: hypothetical protein VGM90_21420 [Kofleriaceae bacterium]
MKHTSIALLLVLGGLSTGCASNRQQAIALGFVGAGAMASGAYVFNDSNNIGPPPPSESVPGSLLFIGGAAAVGYMTYLLVAKDKAWLDAAPDSAPVAQ